MLNVNKNHTCYLNPDGSLLDFAKLVTTRE